MAAPPRPPQRSAKGHGLTAQWHGIPVWLLAAGGAVFAYFLYEHFKSSSSSTSSTNPVTGTVGYGGSYPGNYGGGPPSGGGPPTTPSSGGGPPTTPPRAPVDPGRVGKIWAIPCGGTQPMWLYPGDCIAYIPPSTTPTPQTPVAKSPGSTSISTVTPTQVSSAQKALNAQQIVANQPPAQNPVTTSTGQQTSTSQLAYQNLTSKGYSPQAASQAASQIAAANSGVAPGTPQLVAGTPVVSGSTSATNTNGITPAQAAQQQAATLAQQQALDAQNHINPSLGRGLAPSGAQLENQGYVPANGAGGYWGYVTPAQLAQLQGS